MKGNLTNEKTANAQANWYNAKAPFHLIYMVYDRLCLKKYEIHWNWRKLTTKSHISYHISLLFKSV